MIVGVIILFIISILAFVIGIRSLMGKGYLINNAYIYVSKQKKETMNKKPYYRQSGIVFLLIGLIFLLNALSLLLNLDWIFYIVISVVIATLVYAIISSVIIEKNKNSWIYIDTAGFIIPLNQRYVDFMSKYCYAYIERRASYGPN